jgi:hypothetical protein
LKVFLKGQDIECLFFLSHLFYEDNIIWLNVIFPKDFTYDFFCVNFVNVKIGYMFVEYNGVSLIGGNYKNIP